MTRRAELVRRLLLPRRRGEVRSGDLWRLVLHELQVIAFAEALVLGEGFQGVLGCREGVHKHEFQVLHLELRLHRLHLL
eukprot:CAMPEP_0176091082 /NCGR_PEP_ID=MMETSP0120_2-20121206/45617_1 /TAXON_ID=160619 /ORGANISM="Kryptoperidinium foliaceum, Strain CCMP 1326" /LENGTH=78 /DNA_ID=CAMNT_0017424967 /DNA_START=56 /DNA_END=288 /DNA_ORIENTATION=-